MIKINVTKTANVPVSAIKIQKFLKDFFTKQGIVSDAHCDISFVSEAKMLSLGKKYYRDSKLHSVLTFAEGDLTRPFSYPDQTIYLGEIIVCYPEVVREASRDGELIDDKLLALLAHSGLHLMGVHHEE